MTVDPVALAMREVGEAEVMTRFQRLAEGDVSEKSPGDLVTIADQECERVLGGRLRAIVDAPVVGEEATAADPDLLQLIETAPVVWVVDPVDGTKNFVAGSTDFGVMVALVESGRSSKAWVWHPSEDSMLVATADTRTQRDDIPVPTPEPLDFPVGLIKRKYMPESAKSSLADWPPSLARLAPSRSCAAMEYSDLIAGKIDFLFYWRTLAWDHAPGSLLAEQAGCTVARLDGSPYRPGDGRDGLLSARPDVWDRIATQIRTAIDQ